MYLEISLAKIKKTCYSFFSGMFQLVQCPPLMVLQDNVQALSFLPKTDIKTCSFTIVISSFLEFKAIAWYIFKSRTDTFFKIKVSWTRCYKYHINVIIKHFLGAKGTSSTLNFLWVQPHHTIWIIFFFLQLKKSIDNHNHCHQNRKQESVFDYMESW